MKDFFEKNIFPIALVSLALCVVFLLPTKKTHAIANINFGGYLVNVQECCDGLNLTVAGPNGGTFFISDFALIFGNRIEYNVEEPTGQRVLGAAVPGASLCFDPKSEYCESIIPSEGSIFLIGSTLK